jgi:hypothetical protein
MASWQGKNEILESFHPFLDHSTKASVFIQRHESDIVRNFAFG